MSNTTRKYKEVPYSMGKSVPGVENIKDDAGRVK